MPFVKDVFINVNIATKLATARTIDGVQFTGEANVTRYATCSSSATTTAKTASITAGTFSLAEGARVTVKFTYANSANSPTLNINSSGAKSIRWRGAALTNTQYWTAGQVVDFVYDGTYWNMMGAVNDNDTVSEGGSTSLSDLGITATATELNKLDGVTATTAELNYVDGVTSNIQTQLNAKASSSDINTALNRTNAVNVANTSYTTFMARGTSLNSSDKNPTVNGTIAWTYE